MFIIQIIEKSFTNEIIWQYINEQTKLTKPLKFEYKELKKNVKNK